MAFSKARSYSVDFQQIAEYAKVLCHPERLSILQFLREHGSASVREIAYHSPLSYPVVSQHIALLRRADLLELEIEHPYYCYMVNIDQFERVYRKLQWYCSNII